jgi:hypothetical protein
MPSCSGCRLNRCPTERLATGTPKEDDDMADMTGQVALVTGGARGIGDAITQRLVNRRVKVAAGYSRDAASRRAAPPTPGTGRPEVQSGRHRWCFGRG